MKYLILGDLHLRAKTPRCRTEKDFSKLCIDKLEQVFDVANKYKVTGIIQPGDFFDRAQPAGSLVVKLINLLRTNKKQLNTIHGQHDLIYHNIEASNGSELRKLDEARLLWLARSDDIMIQGVDYGQSIPKPSGCDYNILMSHVMVGDKPLWPGHDLTAPEAFMDKHPGFNLYVFGDYHYPYSVEHNGAWAINAGALIRLTSSESNLKILALPEAPILQPLAPSIALKYYFRMVEKN